MICALRLTAGERAEKYSLSVIGADADSIVMEVRNNSTEPAYLFDTYITLPDVASTKFFRRYNAENEKAKLSFLPFIQYLEIGEPYPVARYRNGVMISWALSYSFTEIAPSESISFKIPKSALTAEYEYFDEDVRSYTLQRAATEASDAESDDTEIGDEATYPLLRFREMDDAVTADSVTVEIAVYNNIDLIKEYQLSKELNTRYIRWFCSPEEYDTAMSDYEIVTCTVASGAGADAEEVVEEVGSKE